MNDLNDMVNVEGGNVSEDSNGGEANENKGNQNKDGTKENTPESKEDLFCEEDEMVKNNGKESMANEMIRMGLIGLVKRNGMRILISEDGSELWFLMKLWRMWSKWGVDDIVMKTNGTCMLKFMNEAGMNKVLELGPWIVNSKPMFVRKWDPTIGMEKTEQTKVPLWVSLVNVPLEAWSKEGISALDNSLGKPLIMDTMTAKRCSLGEGMLDFARIMIEFDVMKGFKEEIEIQYRDKDNNKKGSKHVKVKYSWKPGICSHRNVFGHSFTDCVKRERSVEEIEEDVRKKEEAIRKRNEESKGRNYNSNYMGNRRFRDRKQQKDRRNFNDGMKTYDEKRNKRDILKRKKPGCIKVKDWIQEIMKYYKNLLEMNKLMEIEDGNENIEDVLEANSGIAKYLSTTEVEGIERRSLWEDLRRSKLITNGCPWILMGDFNVTLKMDEHSAGGSKVNEDILEFRECVNDFEVEDSNWSGLFFTWIKSPSKLKPASK
ncbi:RNA-directed DNA polymerase, eukaryota, reverse transcriptase zinc-binding domain protein [Tanacetum coccineum]